MPIEPLRGAYGPDPRPVAIGIDRVLRGLGRPAVDTQRRIVDATRTALGAEMADRVAVLVIGGAVVIDVASAAVASELRWRTAAIIEHLNDAVGPDAPDTVTVRVRPPTASRGE